MWSNDSNPIDKLGKVTYIPVLYQIQLPGTCAPINGKTLTFWTDEGIYKYPYFLVNAHHHKDRYKESHKENILKDSVIFGDSGGLQAVTLGIGKPDIAELTKWQEKNCSIGFGFDELPFKTDVRKLTGWEFDAEHFTEYAQRSYKNLVVALDTVTNPNFKLYGIIQGRKFSEYKQWFDIIKKAGVDGYCMKSPSNNPINVAESCLFAYHNFNDGTPLHLLGMSNFTKTFIIYYFSQYWKGKITFDASTYQQGVQFRTYVHPTSPTLKIRYTSEGTEKMNEDSIIYEDIHDLSFCGCEACNYLTPEQVKGMHKTNDPRFGYLIALHNFISMDRMFKFVAQICHNKTAMRQLIKGVFRDSNAERVCAAFDVIDEGVSKGYDYISAKYKALLSENVEVVKQRTIMDFVTKNE